MAYKPKQPKRTGLEAYPDDLTPPPHSARALPCEGSIDGGRELMHELMMAHAVFGLVDELMPHAVRYLFVHEECNYGKHAKV